MLKGHNARAICCGLLLSCTLSHYPRGQEKRPDNVPEAAKAKKPSEEKVATRNDQERQRLAQDIANNVFSDTRFILNPILKIRIRVLSADAHWYFQPQTARQIVREEFANIAAMESLDRTSPFWSERDGKISYKGIPVEQVKNQLRRELLASASIHDLPLFRELVASEKKQQQNTQTAATDQQPNQQVMTAGDVASVDPEAAARLIQDSFKTGIDDSVPFALMRLRDVAPAQASILFNQALLQAKESGDLWQFQRLVPYILPSEGDRLAGGKHYLTDPQSMLDTKKVVEQAGQVLYRRIQTEPPSNLSPDLVRREYYLWRNLQPVFEDVSPENVWLVNIRLRQLASSLPPPPQSAQGPWSEDRLKTLLVAAEQSSGEKRDQYLGGAAYATWRFGEGDLNKAIALTEKMDDPKLRELTTGTLYFQAGLKYLHSEGPDSALELARKISLPGPRARLFLAAISSLRSVKATSRAEAIRQELLTWLRNAEKNSDTAWALLDYLDAATTDATEDKFTAFEILVQVLNSPNLEAGAAVQDRVYWHHEFHDFRNSLMPLVRTDFDRTLDLVQMLNHKEISLQVQAALAADYLNLQSQRKKTSSTSVLRSN